MMPQLKSTLTRVPSNSHVLSSAIYMNIRTPEKNLYLNLLTFCALGTVCYGMQMFHVILKGDGWVIFFAPESQYDILVQVGRYFSRVASIITNDNQLANSLVYVFWFICIYMLFHLPLLKTKYSSALATAIAASVFLFSPAMIELSVFQIALPNRGFGLFVVGLAIFLFADAERGASKRYWLSSIPLAIAAASYQPIALMYPVGIFFTLIANFQCTRKNLFKGILSCFLGLGLYLISWQLALKIFNVSMAGIPDSYNPTSLNDLPISLRLNWFFDLATGFFFQAKGNMPVISSVIMLVLMVWGMLFFTRKYSLWLKGIFIIGSIIIFVGIVPNLIFLAKGTGSALRPQALLGMFFLPLLIIGGYLGNAFQQQPQHPEKRLVISLPHSIYVLLAVFLVLIQSFQANASVTSRYLAFEKDKATASMVLSDIMEQAPRRDELNVVVLYEPSVGVAYMPEMRYYSSPDVMTGITNNNNFDSRLDSIPFLLKLIAPPQVSIMAISVPLDSPDLTNFPIPDPNAMFPWPHSESIFVAEDGQIFIKFGDPKDPKYAAS